MPTPQKSKSGGAKKTTARKTQRTSPNDAIKLLEADHRQVEKWFKEFEATNGQKTKDKLAEQICTALKVHTQIEEELFYPASREALPSDKEEMVDEAVVEHAAAKNLIAEIEAMEVGEELFDAKVKVLQEMIEHHVEEEEGEYFPECRKSDMDLKAIGEQMKARKQELMAAMGKADGRGMN